MLATSRVAARLVVKRLAADPLVTVTSLLTIATAAVLLAAGPIYAAAVAEGALRETLADAEVEQRSIEIGQEIPVEALAATLDLFDDAADRALDGGRFDVTTRLTSESYGVDDLGDPDGPTTLASFEHVVDLERHATLRDGTWPVAGRRPVQVAVTPTAAAALGVGVGGELTLTDRRESSVRVSARVSAIIEIDDPAAPVWSGADQLILEGFRPSDTFPRLGPLLVAEQDLLARLVPRRLSISRRIDPDPTSISVAEAEAIERRVNRLASDLTQSFDEQLRPTHDAAGDVGIDTGLDRLLSDALRSQAVTDATVYALILQLSILSGYALSLTASLIVETRTSETHLIRSRGATPATLLRLAGYEGLVLVIPAVVAAPWVAALLLRVLERAEVIDSGPLALDPGTIWFAYALAAIAGLAALAALTVPAHRSARRSEGGQGSHIREATRTASHRSGLDLAFLALLVVGIWQLNSLGDELAARVQGRFDVDPLLVLVPALGLIAGGVASLRLVPLAARLAERILQRSRSPIPALSAWQVARRPQRYARTSLLLIMAVTVAFFATSFASTWTGSQSDQATFAIGADARVVPDQRTGVALAPLHVLAGYEQVDGVAAAMPVVRTSRVFRDGPAVDIMAIDAARARQVVTIRPDLAPDLDDLADRLHAMRPAPAGITLTGTPREISVVVSTVQEPPPEPEEPDAPSDPDAEPTPTPEPTPEPPPPADAQARLRVVVRDGNGLLHRIELGDVPMDVIDLRLDATLRSEPIAGAAGLEPVAPLDLVTIEVEMLLAPRIGRIFELSLHAVGARAGGEWADTPLTDGGLTFVTDRVGTQIVPPTVERAASDADDGFGLVVETGVGRGGFVTQVRPRGSDDGTLGAIVTESFLRESGLSVGNRFRWPELDADVERVEIVGAVTALPTIPEDATPAVVFDLAALQLASLDPFNSIDHGSEYWLALDGDPGPVAEALLAAPFRAVGFEARSSREDQLLNDPVAIGAIGALELGILASAVFAAIGFAVSSAVSSRERLREFATLRALGLSPAELARWLATEYAALVLVSLAFGTVLGFVLARVLLPLISLTQQGDLIYPSVVVDHPWKTIAAVDAVIVACTFGATVFVIAGLRRSGLGRHLRMGDE